METAIQRVGKRSDMVNLHIWIPVSINRELDSVRLITGQTKTDAITEALRYWFNAQYKMGVQRGI